MIEDLRRQNVSEDLLEKVVDFRKNHPVEEGLEDRIPQAQYIYIGRKIWEQAITAILQGQHILLVGPKATGKNLLADNLAQLFNRPAWNVSFHVNTDEAQLIGMDTFVDNEVQLRKGPIYLAAEKGGFAVFDEVNMAKNEALAVLHSALDYRRVIDVPGYDRIELDPSCRFIATMNYGYLGTRELNEALLSRFMIIDMPSLDEDILGQIIKLNYPGLKDEALVYFTGFFKDIELKVENSEISSKPLDLRGLLAALGSIELGLDPLEALEMGVINKTFDDFEKQVLRDLAKINLPKDLKPGDVFNG